MIDANVLVSFFVERNEKQRVAGKALLLAAEEGDIVAVVPQFALFEIAYVLDSYYKVPLPTIADAIRATLTFPGVITTDDCSWLRVLDHWPEPLTSITDSGIVAVALENKYSVATFDQKSPAPTPPRAFRRQEMQPDTATGTRPLAHIHPSFLTFRKRPILS